MNSTKLNEWIQTAASLGVIAGLILVAFEVRVSNRLGVDQANAESIEKYSSLYQHFSSVDAADLLVRAQEGDELSRAETYRLDSLINLFLVTMYYDWSTEKTGTISFEGGFEALYTSTIQWYLDSAPARRKWELDKGDWETSFADVIERALTAADRRDPLIELDYIRGATDRRE